MSCYRCGARQIDPVRGPSLWTRGVLAGEQVLICADCQEEGDWLAELDRCGVCGSIKLVRMLGETLCKACGAMAGPVQPAPAGESGVRRPVPAPRQEVDLSAEVAAALDRLFRRKSPTN